MNEELISLETAKLAKEKGFDVPVFNFIKNCGEGTGVMTGLECEMEESCEFYEILEDHNKFKDQEIWSQPTQSLLQKQLREEHDLVVSILVDFQFQPLPIKRIGFSFKITNEDLTIQIYPIVRFNTYEEALEQGLQEALKLLEVY